MKVNVEKQELPVLIFDAGKETVSPGEEHKGMLSSPNVLAHSGMRAELDITYGMLIGGSKCQLVVAQSVLRSVSGTNAVKETLTMSRMLTLTSCILSSPTVAQNEWFFVFNIEIV